MHKEIEAVRKQHAAAHTYPSSSAERDQKRTPISLTIRPNVTAGAITHKFTTPLNELRISRRQVVGLVGHEHE